MALKIRKIYSPNLDIKPRKKYNNIKITPDIEKFIINKINNNNIITTKKIKFLIFENFNIKLSKTSIYFILHKNNISFKKTKIITNPYSHTDQVIQINNVKNEISKVDINNIISIDEMSIIAHQKPKYGWSKKGKRCFIYNKNRIVDNK